MVPTATWYYLWVTDSSGVPRFQRWLQSLDLGCDMGQPLCRIALPVYLLPGNGTWWVQTWNPAGFGPWTAAQVFGVPGPLYAVVAADGTLNRGNAASVVRQSLGRYRVHFGRNITMCGFVATLGTIAGGFPETGIVGVARSDGNPDAVFLDIRDTAFAVADRAFHLTVICP
jgi:hypothetical protein